VLSVHRYHVETRICVYHQDEYLSLSSSSVLLARLQGVLLAGQAPGPGPVYGGGEPGSRVWLGRPGSWSRVCFSGPGPGLPMISFAAEFTRSTKELERLSEFAFALAVLSCAHGLADCHLLWASGLQGLAGAAGQARALVQGVLFRPWSRASCTSWTFDSSGCPQ
jgi:hypothetical protein